MNHILLFRSHFLLPNEVACMFGFLAGGVIFISPKNDIVLLLILVASAFVLVNLRMKCTLAFFYLFLFVAIAGKSKTNWINFFNPFFSYSAV